MLMQETKMKFILLFYLIPFTIYSQIVIAPNDYTSTAGGGFVPEDLSPYINLVHNTGVTIDGTSGRVTAWTDGESFDNGTDVNRPFPTASGMLFHQDTLKYLALADNGANGLDVGTSDFSVEFWLQYTAAGAQRIYHNTGSNPHIRIVGQDNDGIRFSFNFYNPGGDSIANLTSTTVLTDAALHHWVVVVDRNVGAYLYLDGAIDVTEETTEWTNLAWVNMNNTNFTTIGRADGGLGFGYLKVLRQFPSALTAGNVSDLFDYGSE